MEFAGNFEGYEGKEFKSTLARNSKANLQINVIEVSFAFKKTLSFLCAAIGGMCLYCISLNISVLLKSNNHEISMKDRKICV